MISLKVINFMLLSSYSFELYVNSGVELQHLFYDTAGLRAPYVAVLLLQPNGEPHPGESHTCQSSVPDPTRISRTTPCERYSRSPPTCTLIYLISTILIDNLKNTNSNNTTKSVTKYFYWNATMLTIGSVLIKGRRTVEQRANLLELVAVVRLVAAPFLGHHVVHAVLFC